MQSIHSASSRGNNVLPRGQWANRLAYCKQNWFLLTIHLQVVKQENESESWYLGNQNQKSGQSITTLNLYSHPVFLRALKAHTWKILLKESASWLFQPPNGLGPHLWNQRPRLNMPKFQGTFGKKTLTTDLIWSIDLCKLRTQVTTLTGFLVFYNQVLMCLKWGWTCYVRKPPSQIRFAQPIPLPFGCPLPSCKCRLTAAWNRCGMGAHSIVAKIWR